MIEAPLASHRRSAPAFFLLLGLILVGGRQPTLAQFDFGGFGSRGDSASEVTVESHFAPAKADRPALLFVSARIADGFHIFAIDQEAGGPLPTQISIAANAEVEFVGPWQATTAPETHVDQEIWTGLELREHSKQVTWFAPIKLAPTADPGRLTITGTIEGQACNPNTCIPFEKTLSVRQGPGLPLPAGVTFPTMAPTGRQTPLNSVAPGPVTPGQRAVRPNPNPTTPQQLESDAVPAHLYDLSQISLTAAQEGSFVYYLITAFFGGLILNVMPCVLPVIGLKVMSFVQQAGQSRAHAWALNCWYSAGILAVFLVLASLAVTFKLGWGGQFGSNGFNITLIGIVFAMSLSLLGMWEIPIPGFIGTGAAVEITQREGPTAAFLKGILTTLLATPCTGPFMATALAWSIKQPAWMTYTVFGVLGLGMASPYLLIGAFPSLIRFLPKPGAWMETFKKIMGLVLLATMVWLLTFIDSPLVVPTVALLVGIATACWWITQTPSTAARSEKAYGWVTALMIVAISAMSSYGWLYRDVMKPRFEKKVAKYAEQQIGEDRLRISQELSRAQSEAQLRQLIAALSAQTAGSSDQGWQSFSLAKLGQLTMGEGRTVLVDFTADWCLTCKTLEKLVLKTQPVEEALTLAKVVTMEADYTKRPEAIDRTIKALGGVGVPLIAIFPAGDPYHPIVFSDGQYTKGALIEAIARATGRKDLLQGKTSGKAALSQTGHDESRR